MNTEKPNYRLEALQMIAKIKKEMAQHKCNAVKQVGDRVIVWDGSHNQDTVTGEERHGIDPLFEENEAIVIDVNQQVFLHTDYFKILKHDPPIQLDLLLVFPNGTKVYCASSCVKLANK